MLKHCSTADLRRPRSGSPKKALKAFFAEQQQSPSSPTTKDASTSPLITTRFIKAKVPVSAMKASRQKMTEEARTQVRVPIKVYAKCLRSDIEYKTLSVSSDTTSKEVIWTLLSKYRMKHRDPKLFYLTLDISIKRTGIPLRRSLSLDDDAKPVELKSCHPWGECKFTLQMRRGGVIRIYDSILMAQSKYKCLLVSEATTAREVIGMLFHCYGLSNGSLDDYFIAEVVEGQSERRLRPNERPMVIQGQWNANEASSSLKFVLREEDGLGPRSDLIDDDDDDDIILEEIATSSNADRSSSSHYSALRFSSRGSTESNSTRSSESVDSGLLKSSPDSSVYFKSKRVVSGQHGGNGSSCNSNGLANRRKQQLMFPHGNVSLTSLLDALPAASVDEPDGSLDAAKTLGTSLSSLSLESKTSDYDSFFYI